MSISKQNRENKTYLWLRKCITLMSSIIEPIYMCNYNYF